MCRIIREDLERIYLSRIIDWDRFNNKTVLITGAYGMLASYMAFMLIYLNEINANRGITILAMGRNRERFYSRFGQYCEKPYFHMLLQNAADPFDTDMKADFIIHAAGAASSQYYFSDPVGVMLPNVAGTVHVLEKARKDSAKGVLLFSSGEVYGDIGKPVILETDYGALDTMDVRNCYGESKRVSETLGKCYAHQYGIPVKIARISHTYGPTMDIENDSRVFSEFVSDIVNERNITMKSDGSATRPFCYISDATKAYFKLLLDVPPGEAYNVANNRETLSIRELAEMLVTLFPEKKLKVVTQQPNGTGPVKTGAPKTIVSTEKLEALGWRCNINAKEGFKRTIFSFMQKKPIEGRDTRENSQDR